MSRVTAAIFLLLASILGCAGAGPSHSPSRGSTSPRGAPPKRVRLRGRHLVPATFTHTGKIYKHCTAFKDPEGIVSQGPISRVVVYHGARISGIQLYYGDAPGLVQGCTDRRYMTATEWKVPHGERIVRVEGETGPQYVTRLQFVTDKGSRSPRFGQLGGKRFSSADPNGFPLRTISGWANLKRHRNLSRALASITLHFGGRGHYLKDIRYDLSALEAAKLKAAPERFAQRELTNATSLEQQAVYEPSTELTVTRTLTFQESVGLELGASVQAGIPGVAEVKASYKLTASVTAGQTYTNTKTTRESWKVPVRVPPGKKVIATSTWRKYQATVPFTYVIAYYEGPRDNVVEEVTLPGVYTGVHISDVSHTFKEFPLD